MLITDLGFSKIIPVLEICIYPVTHVYGKIRRKKRKKFVNKLDIIIKVHKIALLCYSNKNSPFINNVNKITNV